MVEKKKVAVKPTVMKNNPVIFEIISNHLEGSWDMDDTGGGKIMLNNREAGKRVEVKLR